jgi:hypothetical protein
MIYDAFSKYSLISQAVNDLCKYGLKGYFHGDDSDNL